MGSAAETVCVAETTMAETLVRSPVSKKETTVVSVTDGVLGATLVTMKALELGAKLGPLDNLRRPTAAPAVVHGTEMLALPPTSAAALS